MRLINIIKSAFTGKTYNDKQPQLVMPTKPEYRIHPVKPVRNKVDPEVWKRNAQHLTNAAKNVKGTNLMKINNPHIDFSRSMKIPEHMNGDNLKMKSYR